MDKNKSVTKAWYEANFQKIEKSVKEDDWPKELNDLNAGKNGFTLRMEIICVHWAGGRNCKKGLESLSEQIMKAIY